MTSKPVNIIHLITRAIADHSYLSRIWLAVKICYLCANSWKTETLAVFPYRSRSAALVETTLYILCSVHNSLNSRPHRLHGNISSISRDIGMTGAAGCLLAPEVVREMDLTSAPTTDGRLARQHRASKNVQEHLEFCQEG